MNRLSRILRPVASNFSKTEHALSSRSQILFDDLGFTRRANNGTFYLLPLMQRTVEKCTRLIDSHMRKLDAQKITIPHLTSANLWRESGRFDNYKSELLTTTDRQQKVFVLGPTFEEAATDLIALAGPISLQQLPLRLYQIDHKFRDEQMPRHGLLRAREFIMKDMYTFDKDKEAAMQTYDEVNQIYSELFGHLGVPFAKVEADATEMGGSMSHEYHFLAPGIGDEILSICSNCRHSFKFDENNDSLADVCEKCETKSLTKNRGIEIGHTFYLGETYTAKQKGVYSNASGKPVPLQMGCMGIGVTRLIAAAVETLSSEREIRWPWSIAPFHVCIVSPKRGSNEETSEAQTFVTSIYKQLNDMDQLSDSIVIDDRSKMTIGKRLMEIKCLGIPLIVVIGRKAAQPENPQIELHFTRTGTSVDLSPTDLIQEIAKFIKLSSE